MKFLKLIKNIPQWYNGTNLITDIYHNRSVFPLSHQSMFHGSGHCIRDKNFTLILFIDLAL